MIGTLTWIIILCVAAVLALLLLIPVRIYLVYDKTLKSYVKIGFIKIPLEKKEKKEKPQKSSEKGQKKPEKKADSGAKIKKLLAAQDDFKELLSYAARRAIVVEKIEFKLDFGTDSAAATGILTGAVNAAVYMLLSVIHHNTLLKKQSIEINPNFENECFNIYLCCICRTRAVHIIPVGIKALGVMRKYR